MLPNVLALALRDDLPTLADEIVWNLETAIPDYGKLADDQQRRAARRGVERTLTSFLARFGEPTLRSGIARMHREIGRAEQREGRSADAVHAAYWLGARLCWTRWVHLAHLTGLSPADVCRFGDLLLGHVGELCSHAAEGYAAAENDTEQSMGRARGRLPDLLTSASPLEPDVLRGAAAAARWPLPETAVVVVLDTGDAAPVEVGRWDVLCSPPDVLWSSGKDAFLVVPGPEAAERAAEAGQWIPAGWVAVTGPAMSLEELRVSRRVAMRCLDLIRHGLIDAPVPGVAVRSTDHIDALLLLHDTEASSALLGRHVLPLERLTRTQQDRLVDTVLAWLACGGSVPPTARRLGVHPQTVHYRLRQARAIFGPAVLGDPGCRLELELALRVRQLLRAK